MRKYLAMLSIFLTLFLTACTNESKPLIESPPTDESPPDSKKEISLRITWKAYSGRGETVQRIIQDFNDTQADYKITLHSGDEDLNSTENHLLKDDYDVYVLPYRFVQYFGSKGLLHPLDASAAHAVSPDLTDLAKIEGRLYGMPWVSHSMALLYNKSLLDAAGVDPKSIVDRQSFIDVLTQVESKTSAQGIGLVGAQHHDLSWMVNQFIYGNSGTLESDGQITISSEPAKTALHYYIDALGQHAQPSWHNDTGLEVMTHFRNGDVAFEIQGLWGVTDIEKSGAPFEVGILPLSSIDTNAEVGPLMLCVGNTVTDEKLPVIKAFINYMISKPAQEAILFGEYSPEHDAYYPFRLPVRSDALSSDFLDAYPGFNVFIDAYNQPSIEVPSPQWMAVKASIYTDYLHQMVTGDLSIEEGLEKIQKDGMAIYEGEQ